MAYDEELLQRVREMLIGEKDVVAKKMFGAIVFLVNGNIAVGVGEMELTVRVGKDTYEDILKMEGVREFDFTGKPIVGFVYVDETGFTNDQELEMWVSRGVDYARTLPKKKSARGGSASGGKKSSI